jgi:hypothetical protein
MKDLKAIIDEYKNTYKHNSRPDKYWSVSSLVARIQLILSVIW